MPRREPPPPKDFAFDFTADWPGVANIPSGSDAALGWTLHGTVRKHGQTYGLAYRGGMYAACTIHGQVFDLTALERSRISMAAHFKEAPGWENAPKAAEPATVGLTGPARENRPVGYSRPRIRGCVRCLLRTVLCMEGWWWRLRMLRQGRVSTRTLVAICNVAGWEGNCNAGRIGLPSVTLNNWSRDEYCWGRAMCYSAMVWADWHLFKRKLGVDISITDFYEQFYKRRRQGEIFPKAMDLLFSNPQNDDERRIKALIEEMNADQANAFERELFTQRKRLNDAERTLQTKATKKATEDKRIVTNKIERALVKLDDLKRTDPKPRDSRIFPNWYAPVLINDGGQLKLIPMHYHCRPAGMPASSDWIIDKVTKRRTISGKYNARRDNLERFWRKQFGYTHGIAVVSSFYENVPRQKNEGRDLAPGEREENMVLHFNPQPPHDMLIACLWSHWQEGDDDLYSFAAITDEPPPEIAAAGHDRCIVPIKPENMLAWLNPDSAHLAAMQAILDDRDRSFYEYSLAA